MGRKSKLAELRHFRCRILRKFRIGTILNGYAWYAKGTALKALGQNSEADAAKARAKNRWFTV